MVNEATSNDIMLKPEKKNFAGRFLSKFKVGFKEYGYLSIAFAAPAAVMLLIYIALGIHPIADFSVLVLDLNGQYVSFYEGLRNFIYGDMSLLYSFCRALGGEFMGMYAYYLASPFSYIVALFPQNMILEALLTIFILKTGCCGLTFGIYLHKTSAFKKSFSRVTVVAFSMMYALSAYCVVQQHNSMWIDAVIWLPIITYGIEELIKKGHYKTYVISLAISILSNFYLGWMTCIYCAVYFFVYYFMHNENDRNNPYGEKKHFPKTFLRMLIFSILAVMIAAIIIFTAYYSLTFGKTSFSNTNWSLVMRYDILDMLVKFLPSSYDTVRPEGLPFVYCGVLVLLLVPAYFCCHRYTVREKIMSGVFIAFFLLSFAISPVDIIWHGFQKPNWLNYRYSFMLCFFLLTLAHKGILEIRRVSYKALLFTSGLLILLIGIAQKLDLKTFLLGDGSNDRNHEVGKLLTIECIWFAVIAVGIYVLILCVMRKTQRIQNIALIMTLVVGIEMFCNGLCNCLDLGSDVVYTSYSTYHKTIDPLRAVTSVIKDSDESFYRLEEIYHRKSNDNMALNVYGLTNSTSTLNATTIRFIRNMGYVGKSHESRYYAANLPADSLLGVKYVLAGASENGAEYRTDKVLLSDEKYYSQYFSDSNYAAYQNLYALSLAYAVNENIADIDMAEYHNPYDRLNAIITAMLGEEETILVFHPLEHTSSSVNLTSSVRKPGASSNYKYPFTNYLKTDTSKGATLRFTINLPYIDTPEDVIQQIEDLKNGLGGDDDDDYEYDEENPDEDYEYDDIERVSPESQYIYFYLPSEFQRAFSLTAPFGSYGSVFGSSTMRSLFIGNVPEGTSTSVTLTLETDNLYITNDVPLFYYLDFNVYKDVMTRLAEQQLKIEEGFTDSHLKGTITTTSDRSSVFTSIPFDKGWRVLVDGKLVETYGILGDSSLDDRDATDGALVAFNIEDAGEHKVELIYMPTAFVLGASISVIGVIILVLLFIFGKKINPICEKILMPLEIPEKVPSVDEEPTSIESGEMIIDQAPDETTTAENAGTLPDDNGSPADEISTSADEETNITELSEDTSDGSSETNSEENGDN